MPFVRRECSTTPEYMTDVNTSSLDVVDRLLASLKGTFRSSSTKKQPPSRWRTLLTILQLQQWQLQWGSMRMLKSSETGALQHTSTFGSVAYTQRGKRRTHAHTLSTRTPVHAHTHTPTHLYAHARVCKHMRTVRERTGLIQRSRCRYVQNSYTYMNQFSIDIDFNCCIGSQARALMSAERCQGAGMPARSCLAVPV